ncbi:amino acid adenylation domain-containing protein [Chitinimonas lacunae]|uniref:Amino acid adenylation domain-containing protein n=1 Tax=Chitinimonas lacunae TaxID=1963018 RepID=A0ABV8MQ45_9NEIS
MSNNATLEQLKRAVMLQKLRQRQESGGAVAGQTLAPVRRDQPLPLSWAQQRLWFLEQYQPGLSRYNMPLAWRLEGQLDYQALGQALNDLLARHEILRTGFVIEAEQAVQQIAKSLTLSPTLIDLSDQPDAEAAALDRLRLEAARPFDLTRAPLLRVHLVKLAPATHLLLLTMHHIVSDGWSMGVAKRELSALYQARLSGVPANLPPLPLQYADFSLWQRDWLQGPLLAQQLDYWKRRLAGAPAMLALPTDRPHQANRSEEGASVAFELSTELSGQLRQLSQQAQATLFMTLAAVFKVLLYRYSQQEDLSIGYPVANRQRPELEGLIGFFVNTLVLRTRLTPEQTFMALLRQVRDAVLDADAHQDLPFEKLVEALQPERSLSHTPLFQVMLTLNNTAETGLVLGEALAEPVRLGSVSAKFDLTLGMGERDGQLVGSLNYSTALFDATTIERMVGHFRLLLEAVVAAPQTPLKDLPLLSAADQRQLAAWNETARDYPHDRCTYQLFEAQAAERPDAVAVLFGEQTLSYSELNRRANRLAHHLVGLGVGPDTLVALCLDRSLEMLVGLLAVMKAGGAYVPLDPAYPSERLAHMLDDSAAAVLLTQSVLLTRLPAHSARVVCLDEPLTAGSDQNLAARARSEHLAYCLYTSGSTGKPKGVLVGQRQLVNFLCSMAEAPALGAQDTLLAVTTLSFDIAGLELYLPLISGARIVLASRSQAGDPQQLADLIAQHRVTVLQATPATWRMLLDSGWPGAPDLVGLCGGERLDAELAGRMQSALAAVWNLYGPTETTIWSTRLRLDGEQTGRPVSIGRPIANTRIHILDPELRPLPPGLAGEIHIGGAGVARGYLNRPDLSRERFIPDPFDRDPAARLYKTGDLGRWLADGTLEYLGRNDFQVKIRGYRIELGEIEARLAACDGVRQAVVVARGEPGGDQQLVAYLLAEPQATLTPAALRAQLAAHLADPMLPSAFMVLEAFPLTPNGKLDRKALPAPAEDARIRSEFEAPLGETETVLASLWQGLLKLEQVGRHDNFFALGGHSLLATQVVARIRQAFQIELPLRSFFAAQTLAELARQVALAQGAEQPRIAPTSRHSAPVSSFAQQRLWFLEQYEPGSPLYNMPVAWRLKGRLDYSALAQSLNDLLARHEVLRTHFVLAGDVPLQQIAASLTLTPSMVDLSGQSDAEAEALHRLRLEAARPFDLTQAPLLRAHLVKLDATTHLLLLTMHHIVSDGWSMGIVKRELSALYQAHTSGQTASLPPLPIQYADFSVWQRNWLQGPLLARQVEYWKRRLEGAPAVLELPTDRPRPASRTLQGAAVPLALSAELSGRLRQLSRQAQTTLFMTLAAVFNVLLHRYSQQDDISIGYPVANRQRAEIEGLIGFFVNTLVLRTRLQPEQRFIDLLAQVRESVLDADAHQDLPFEKLVEELQPERSLSHTPLFQVMLSLNNTAETTLGLGNLAAEPVRLGGNLSAKFDLTLSLFEQEGCLLGSLAYSTDLFEAATVARMVGHFRTLLEAVVAAPQTALKDLPLLTAAEAAQLAAWNDTAVDYPLDRCIHELFEGQVTTRPEAIAVRFGAQQWCFAELNRRANQLAHRLVGLGVGPDTLVAICLERSLEMVLALLAVLKAGGAYVPLDPDYPTERLAYLLKDAAAPLLLTQSSLLDRLPQHAAQVLCLDQAESFAAQDDNLPIRTTPDHLAYCIYTSGSTGQPKGVLVSHRSLLGSTLTRLRVYGPAGRFLLLSPVSFDSSIAGIFASLCAGDSLVVAERELLQDPVLLWRALQRDRIGSLLCVPTMLQQLADCREAALPDLHTVIVAGEAVTPALWQGWRQAQPHSRLFNEYGPTEATVWATVFQGELAGRASVPIGRPIANTRIYLLDRALQPVPIGVPGEIHIAGAGLARGYLGRPELTAERFLACPFAEGRMYRTGDLARYLADGQIEFLGRVDHQIKLRGFRIELGEIEHALLDCPGVREALLILDETGQRLVAYLTAQAAGVLEVEALRSRLRERLPGYMVPAAWVVLERFPLTPNGKVDRKALPAPEGSRPREAAYVAPEDATETLLGRIWAEVLGVAQVGVHDNFFDSGGSSLSLIKVRSRIREALGVELSIVELFRYPTIRSLAQSLSQPAAAPAAAVAQAPRADRLARLRQARAGKD